MKRILFQGDSVTDAGRQRDSRHFLGSGYPTLVAARMGADRPGAFEFVNLGISGNRVVDLYARWKRDCLNEKPDVVSILIGINDVWHELGEAPNGVDADKFFTVYDLLLKETQAKLPGVRLIVLEPFVHPGAATREHWDYFSAETPLRARAARALAERYGAAFVPLQAVFDAALDRAPAEHWTLDGVHPSAAGHQLIADAWIKAYDQIG